MDELRKKADREFSKWCSGIQKDKLKKPFFCGHSGCDECKQIYFRDKYIESKQAYQKQAEQLAEKDKEIGRLNNKLMRRKELLIEKDKEIEKYKYGKSPLEAFIPYEVKLKQISDKVGKLEEAVLCPLCNNVGDYGEQASDGECIQVQCEFCWTNKNSLFNKKQELKQLTE